MKIYNERTNELEKFIPIEKNVVKMYVCGPTIYSDIHIGNARPIIFFDFIYKFMQDLGYSIMYVSNITDVDDKIINAAILGHTKEKDIVEKNYNSYIKVLKDINIKPYYKQPRVTDYMSQIIEFIKILIKNGDAYEIDGDVYFSVNKSLKYGEISNVNIEDLKSGEKADSKNNKRNINDFTLWKKTKLGISWESPWSNGRPGWHTECVAMIRDILGDEIDIHGGGVDLKFPHHENENAQSNSCGKNLAKYWMHNGFINFDNQKMSKSIGNIKNVKEFIEEHDSNVLRLIMFQTNYRRPINLTDEFIEQTTQINKKFENFFIKIKVKEYDKESIYVKELREIISEDFNTANAITYLLGKIKEFNEEIEMLFLYSFDILGLVYSKETNDIPVEIQELIEKRDKAKEKKQFSESDRIREEIESLGYQILDTRNGVECKQK